MAGVRALEVDLLAVQEVDRQAGPQRPQRPASRDRSGPGSGLVLVLCSCPGRRRLPATVWPRPGRSRLRQPAGVAAAAGRRRAAAVPPGRRRGTAHRDPGQHPGGVAPGHGGGHPSVQPPRPQRPPAAGAAAGGRRPGAAAAAGGRPEHALNRADVCLPAGLARDRAGPHLARFPPPPSSCWTISCATTRPGRSSPAGPGWSPRRSATTAPWSSSSTSQPPDSQPTARSVVW